MPDKRNSLKVNAVLNIIKQCCAIIFPLITFPYVSRTLGVEAYGKVNFSSSIISYISLLAGLGVSSYAVREGARIRDDKNKFEKFASEVFSINVVSTVIAYVLLAILVLFWKKLEPYRVLIVILSINVLLTTLGTDWINTVYEDFLYLTIRYVLCQSIAVVTTLLFVKKPDDVALYAFFSNLGTIFANILNLFYIRRTLRINVNFTLKMNVKHHFRPIMLLFGNMISSMIYLYSDTTMLGILASDAAVGYYTVSSKIYSLLKQVINAVSNVLTPRLSHDFENKAKKNMTNNINSVLGALLVVVIPITMGMLCMGREIILLIAGKEYLEAYPALSILSVTLIFSTYACIFVSVIMLAQRKDKEILIASGISAAVNILLNLILIPQYSYNAAAFTTFISECLMLAMGIYYTHHTIKVEIRKYLVLATIGGIEVQMICHEIKCIVTNGILALFISIILCGAIYGMTILLLFLIKKRRRQKKYE
jgi:O-antigen/teichoic acid export membrane protein